VIEIAAGLVGLGVGLLFGYHRGLASHEDQDEEDLAVMGSMYEAATERANRLERRLDAALNQNNEHRKQEHENTTHSDPTPEPLKRKPYRST
jgi:hypothetical protein